MSDLVQSPAAETMSDDPWLLLVVGDGKVAKGVPFS